MKVGDTVCSWDFPHDDSTYVIGKIVAIEEWEHCEFNCGLPHVHIMVTHDSWAERNLVGEMVYPVHPESGALGFHEGGKASRIKIIEVNE